MPLNSNEILSRHQIKSIFASLDDTPTTDIETIRSEALKLFTRNLDAKISNLQEGEALQITYRVDIITPNGEVRGGSGFDRGMPEYAQWRDAVYTRDSFTCQECKQVGGELNAHHIRSWATSPELRFDVENGVTLCFSCHGLKHPHLNFYKKQRVKTNKTYDIR
jgi:hypothetical protein